MQTLARWHTRGLPATRDAPAAPRRTSLHQQQTPTANQCAQAALTAEITRPRANPECHML